jgi:multidrug resistance efflux pump
LDIARAPKSKKGRYIGIGAGLVAIVGVSVALTRMEPAAPSVERATLWIDTVRRGTMVRQVRAPGTLVPEQIRWVSALTAGRVEALPVRPGTAVTPETQLLELSNPDVQLQALEAERQLAAAEAELVNLRSSLETQRLQQQASVAQINTQYQEARRNAEVMAALDNKGLSSTNEVQRANETAAELKSRVEIERQRLALLTQNVKQQFDMQRANVERARGIAQFQRDRVMSMKVKAGEEGVLQEMNLQLGQWVVPGEVLARVAQPSRLKAVLRVPETQAKDVVLGQPVSVDTRNGIIPGRVIRIEPQSVNGTVGVDVALEGALPRGARPELSVDGTIEIERLTNVMYVGRPAYGQAESVVGLFRLDPDGQYARRVNAKLGRSSVNTIEVVQGLNVGDLVIISDVSQWDAQDRLRLK